MTNPPTSAVELLQTLIRIPSVNPDGDPGTEHVGEGPLAEWLARLLEAWDVEASLEEVLPGRPNVIGRFPTDQPGKPKILFGPHTDTVSVSGMTIDPFGGILRDGKIFGRGASDTKGSMAAMLWALHEERAILPTLTHEIHFVGFMAEETGQYGSKHFAERYPDYAFAIIGEPTNDKVVFTHKGCLWVDLVAKGIAAHGATPERGRNAISAIAPLIPLLDGVFRQELAESGPDATLGAATINLGMIRGGTRANIVPEECRLTIDIRTTPLLEARGGALPLLRSFLDRHGFHDIEMEPRGESKPLFTDPAHPLVTALAANGEGLTGAPWFCDAAILAQAGIPAVAVGPGSIAQAHTADEYLAVTDMDSATAMFRRFLRSLMP